MCCNKRPDFDSSVIPHWLTQSIQKTDAKPCCSFAYFSLKGKHCLQTHISFWIIAGDTNFSLKTKHKWPQTSEESCDLRPIIPLLFQPMYKIHLLLTQLFNVQAWFDCWFDYQFISPYICAQLIFGKLTFQHQNNSNWRGEERIHDKLNIVKSLEVTLLANVPWLISALWNTQIPSLLNPVWTQ